jgi:hypothetical protein
MPVDSHPSERRRTERRPTDSQGKLSFDTDVRVLNVSQRGLEVETDERLMVGAPYSLTLRAADGEHVVGGTVVWSRLDRTVLTRAGEISPVYRSGIEAASTAIPVLERLADPRESELS